MRWETKKLPVNYDAGTECLRLVDELIRRIYQTLLQQLDNNVKTGDFIKMVELRRKLAPEDPSQKELWKLLEKVRRELLGSEKKSSVGQTINKKPPTKKVARR